MKIEFAAVARRSLPFMIALPFLVPALASAQHEAGVVFNDQFNVGLPLLRPVVPDEINGEYTAPGLAQPISGVDTFRGSVACGGTSSDNGASGGASLTSVLNAALGQQISGENDLAREARILQVQTGVRELWRFCDAMTFTGGDWTSPVTSRGTPEPGGAGITREQEQLQNEGLAPAGLFTQSEISRSLMRAQMQNIMVRIQTLRLAASGRSPRSPALASRNAEPATDGPAFVPASALTADPLGDIAGFAGQSRSENIDAGRVVDALMRSGLSASGDGIGLPKLGLFVNGRYHYVHADTTPQELGSRTNGGGVTAGVDYRFLDSLIVGLAFGYTKFFTNFDHFLGTSDVDDFALFLYSSYSIGDNFWVSGAVRGSLLLFDQTKQVPTFDGGPIFSELTSDPNGYTVGGDIQAGYDYAWNSLGINPFLGVRIFHTHIQGFVEKGGDGTLALNVMPQNVTSYPLTLGLTLDYALGSGIGVFAPYLRAQYLHEFGDQAANLQGFLNVIPSAGFELKPNDTDRDYAQVGAGVTFTRPGGWAAFVDFDAVLGYKALYAQSVIVGIRKNL